MLALPDTTVEDNAPFMVITHLVFSPAMELTLLSKAKEVKSAGVRTTDRALLAVSMAKLSPLLSAAVIVLTIIPSLAIVF